MSTPTSPETPPEAAILALPDALAAIGQGDFSRRTLTALSDLDRSHARTVMRAWPTWSADVRRRLVVALDEVAETQVILNFTRVLRNALDDSDAMVRQRVIAALWEDESSIFLDRLLVLLDDPVDDVRAEAARALGRFAERGAAGDLDDDRATALFVSLESRAADRLEPDMVRRRALESAASYGPRGQVRLLIQEAFDADDSTTRAGAICAMGRTYERRWVSTILDEMESDDAEIRYEAARAAGLIGDDDAVSGLAVLASDEDPEVRFAAVSALGAIGSAGATRALHHLLADANDEEREAIEEALEIADDAFPGAGD